jgi:hypothetical protein
MTKWTWVALATGLFLLGGCQGEQRQSDETRETKTEDPHAQFFDQKRIDESSPGNIADWYEGSPPRIVVYFDTAFTDTTTTVERGGLVRVYIVGEWDQAEQMSAAEFRLEVPEALEVVGENTPSYVVLTQGKLRTGVKQAFEKCLQGPQVLLNTVTFMAGEDVRSALIRTHPAASSGYLGFATCDATHSLLPAAPGGGVLNP